MKLQNTLRTLTFMLLITLGSNHCYAQTTDSIPKKEILTFAEQMPEFVGGNEAMYKYLSRTIRYPSQAHKKNKEGKVVLTFIVQSDGTITDVEQVGTPAGYGMDEEAIRVVKEMPKWNPGFQGGKPVIVKYTLPIRFQLN
ncbi:MAG: hypothetical protein CFE21_13195 [Bacteroidetes bacterium B1(2017)]|nr:MAG: hypothetical protein CFE21_13195 [Bacteroidetes bacterium B1(2017)]